MARHDSPAIQEGDDSLVEVPPGCPPWVTADLIADTLATWQPYYADSLTNEDAIEILLTVSHLFDFLENGDRSDEEAVSSTGESFKS